ncbi:U-box domain-containing protein 35-like, partial [Trifolium medium]|nr:U-box domain-containing protein 35-like [Trifolium medium]
SPFTRGARPTHRSYESTIPESDISFVSSGRPSVDRMFPSLYEEMDSGSGITPRLSGGSDYDVRSFGSSFSGGAKSIDQSEYSFSSQDSGNGSMSSLPRISSSAMELQRWKLDEQRKMEDARFSEETALAIAEKEKAKSKVAMEAAEASRKIAELEAQKR